MMLTKFWTKYSLIVLLAGNTIYAEQYTNTQSRNYKNNYQNSSVQIGKDVPDVAKSNRYLYPQIQRDRVELQTVIQHQAYKNIQVEEDARKKIITGMYGVNISMKPDVRLLKDIDFIRLSPNYITEIQLPSEMTITDAKASFPTKHATFAKNSMKVQPKGVFYGGNIPIYFTDGKRNYYMTIVADRYFQNKGEVEDFVTVMKQSSPSIAKEVAQKNSRKSDYAFSKNSFILIYRYVLPKVLNPEDAIVLYERMTHKKGINIEDGDFVSFMYDGITYKIVRDDTQGTLIYGKKAYRVENSLEQ